MEKSKDTVSLMELIDAVRLNWKLILGVTFGVVLVAAAVNYFKLKDYYRSEAIINPEADNSSMNGTLRSFASQLPIGQFMQLGAEANLANHYIELLKTRSLSLAIIEGENYLEEFGVKVDEKDPKGLEKAKEGLAGFLRSRLDVKLNDRGMVTLSFRHENPELAFKVLKSYLTYLQKFLSERYETRTKATEVFVKERLTEAEAHLVDVEKDYISLQQSKGVVQLPSQLGMALNTASQLRAQIMQKEMEIELYRNILKDSSEIQRLQNEKAQLQRQLEKIVSGQPNGNKKDLNIFTPLRQGPMLEMQFSAAERDYLAQVKLVELLRSQYEVARIETKRNEVRFNVIDPPSEPLFPAGPRRTLNIVLSGVLGSIISTFIVLVMSQIQGTPRRLRLVKKSRSERAVEG